MFKKFKRKPTEEELRQALMEVNTKLYRSLQEVTEDQFRKIYNNEMKRVSRELGTKVIFQPSDENVISALVNDNTLADSYSKLSGELTEKINSVILGSYLTGEGLSGRDIKEQIKEVTGLADSRASLIARTETSKVANASRFQSYQRQDGFDQFKFRHIGPNDSRTTQASKDIKRLVGTGVDWNTYVNIVTRVSAEYFPTWTVDPNAPVSHWQSRHTFIRVK